jgi:ATP-binding cassette subfamily B protein
MRLRNKNAKANEKNPERINGKKALFFMLSYVRRNAWAVLAGVLCLMGVDSIQILIPRIIQRTIDALGGTSFSQALILKNIVIILLLALCMVVFRFFWRVFIIGSSRKVERDVRKDMFSHLQILSFNYFNKIQTGKLMALMVNDVNAIRMATGLAFIALTDAIFMGTLSLVVMLSINVRITLYSIIPLPFILIMIAKFGPMIQSRFKAVQESFADISSHSQESFSGIRVVKGFVQEVQETSQFKEKCSDYVERNVRLIRVWGFFFPAVTLLASLSMAILYFIGGSSVILNRLTFGEFVSFSLYIDLLIWPVMAIGWVVTLLQRGIASSRRVLDLLSEEPEVVDSKKANKKIRRLEGKIETKNLTFRFSKDGRAVLRDINLTVDSGSSLGIMGRPGSGKTALVSLFFRLYPLEPNRIKIDGRDIHEFPLTLLRSSIGYVPQDPFLFSDSIRNNITLGLNEEEVDFSEIERVARLTSIYEEIMEFYDGFDTVVGERGVTVSGGQKQRLSIARALMVRPRILIFDDAFSSVDAATEREILQNIFSEKQDRTLLIISHRVSTVKECDLIIVLEDGKIVERGNHSQLLRRRGYYSKLFELQKLEEKIV